MSYAIDAANNRVVRHASVAGTLDLIGAGVDIVAGGIQLQGDMDIAGGENGLVLAAPVPLSPTQVHDLRLTLDDAVITVRAKVVHTRTVVDRDDVSYVSGMAFVDPPRETQAVIEHFLGLDVFADGH